MFQADVTLISGGDPDHFGLLSRTATELWDQVDQSLGHESEHFARRVQGCLDKLVAVLMQGHRLKLAHDELLKTALDLAPSAEEHVLAVSADDPRTKVAMAFGAVTTCADFESLLLQARASLDCLTGTIAPLFKSKTKGFKSLKNVLRHNGGSDRRAKEFLRIVEKSDDALPELLISESTMSGLRDLAAHGESLSGLMTRCFQICFVDTGRVVVVDCELREFPIFRTTLDLLQHISHLILNSVAVLTGKPVLDFDAFQPQWANRTVVISEFVRTDDVSTSVENQVLIAERMVPGGTYLERKTVAAAFFDHAVDISFISTLLH